MHGQRQGLRPGQHGGPGVFGPCGGDKQSGLGRELAMCGMYQYTEVKNVFVDFFA